MPPSINAETFQGLTIPMGRPGHVDEMAGAAVFLAGSLSSYVTGQTIHVDGGTQAASGCVMCCSRTSNRPRAPRDGALPSVRDYSGGISA